MQWNLISFWRIMLLLINIIMEFYRGERL